METDIKIIISEKAEETYCAKGIDAAGGSLLAPWSLPGGVGAQRAPWRIVDQERSMAARGARPLATKTRQDTPQK